MSGPDGIFYLGLVVVVGVASLAFAGWLAAWVLRSDRGTGAMQQIAGAIQEGAEAFLRRQYRTIGILSAAAAALILLLYGAVKGDGGRGGRTMAAFILGAACSAASGYIGMFVSIRANLRTAAAAGSSLDRALRIAMRGGAVSGLTVVALSLLGVGGLFWAFGGLARPEEVPLQIVGFGFGASFVALFAQLGGGIYTKAADVGADLVGKVEAGIPEDDPRNPAVVADLVGDNVGDCAGRGADLFESTAAENIGAMILGVALHPIFGIGGILFPLIARAFGLVATTIGILFVGTREDGDPMKGLDRGYYVTTLLAMGGFWLAVRLLLGNRFGFFVAGVVGILTALAFVYITQYYTEYRYRPVLSIAEASRTGPATNAISGIAVALECTGLPVVVISAALLLSYKAGQWALAEEIARWIRGEPGGISGMAAGLYGTAVATMGMLAPCAYILAMDTFGPITDNAGGIVEMSRSEEAVRRKTDRLDSVGNTTKALTKGYAIGSAALAAFLLFRAYLDEVQILAKVTEVPVDITRVPVFVGALLGACLVFVFSAFAIRAVGRAAQSVIEEVRRQFRENAGIMQGTAKPDYGRCVDIVTVRALKEMVVPGLMPILVPIAVGLGVKWGYQWTHPGMPVGTVAAEAVAALLMVGTIGGILLATVMNNGGGAWDNAKKYIETGALGGRGSEAHKAAVVGDTIGDPLKDTAGPSIHVLVKLLSTITLVFSPLFL
jgi:K(+)-stimulated pyrophosphate-energized sodium pump